MCEHGDMVCMCAPVYVCIFVIGKTQKKRSMALELTEFEVEFFGRQKKSLVGAREGGVDGVC